MFIIRSGAIVQITEGREEDFVSPFAEEIFNLDSRSHQLDSWKYAEDESAPEQGMIPRSMLWGGKGKLTPPSRVKASLVSSAPGRLYYVLEMTNSAGLFYFDFDSGQETRLFHRTDFKPRGLYIDDDYSILTTSSSADGCVHLVKLDPEGKRETILTSGDCIDENPCAHGSKVFYQSSGIARGDQGIILATGNSEINVLDTGTGEVETVLASPRYDYLLPRVDPEGAVYCLQVPQRAQATYSFGARLIDVVLFPYRLAVAMFAFLNVFSMFFAKKPLTRSGGPDAPPVDISRRILHNRVVNLQETMKREGRKVAVSSEWKLIKLKDGEQTVVASNVLWYELDEHGRPFYTDGYAVFDSSGAKRLQCDELVSGVCRKHESLRASCESN